MTILKNTDRAEVLRRALSDTFAPRFFAVELECQRIARADLVKNHPEFVRMYKDENCRKYLATRSIVRVYLQDEGDKYAAGRPKFGQNCSLPTTTYFGDFIAATYITLPDVIAPATFGDSIVADASVVDDYIGAWRAYTAAWGKLNALLNSYKSREKFAVDFPELAKYLPATTVAAKLPMVIVDDVRRDLAALGIPNV